MKNCLKTASDLSDPAKRCRDCREKPPDHLRWCAAAYLIPDRRLTLFLRTIVISAGIILVIVLGAVLLTHWFELRREEVATDVTYSKLTLDVIKVVLTGFVVTLIVAFIPIGFTSARDNFERTKESRIAFSRAQTGVDYLAVTLCALELREAGALLQRVHVWKHRAQSYDELQLHLKRRGDDLSNLEWADKMYVRLCRARRCLEDRAEHWDRKTPDVRLAWLQDAADSAREELKKLYPERPDVWES